MMVWLVNFHGRRAGNAVHRFERFGLSLSARMREEVKKNLPMTGARMWSAMSQLMPGGFFEGKHP